ncbi:MAG: hypothetical protein AAGH65_00580 [Pseudomonadota bacterium]
MKFVYAVPVGWAVTASSVVVADEFADHVGFLPEGPDISIEDEQDA